MAINSSTSCRPYPDDVFGPVVDECARAFDFTLLFEESILSILPSALLLLAAPVRLYSLRRRKDVVGGNVLRIGKLAAIIAFGATQAAILALWALNSTQKTRASVAAAALNVANSLIFIALSFTEHSKSLHPSGLLNGYLFFSILFDIVRTRTLWMIDYDQPMAIPAIFSAALGFKVMILVLEEANKTSYIHKSTAAEGIAAEETAGIFSRTLFWWLNSLIRTGFSKILHVETLPTIDKRLCSESLLARFSKRWEETPKEGNNVLMITVFKSLLPAVLAPVIPLLCILALTVTQPLLMQTFLEFLSEPDDGTQEQMNRGWGLVAAYAIVYISVAFGTAWSQQFVYRFVSMVRGILVTTIYRKTTSVSIVGLDDAAAVTLMSTDVERIVAGLSMMHEIWTTILQIGVSLFLLYRLVWVAILVPLFMFILCGVATGALAGQAGERQSRWMQAIEKRVGVTSSMLGAMKGVKMSGLSEKMSSIISSLRLAEIASAHRYRTMLVYVVTLSYTPSTISPIITFAAFAKIAENDGTILDSTRIFTTLSLISLITEPLTALFHALPEFFTAMACFSRIQQFLLAESRQDTRQCVPVGNTAVVSVTSRNSDTESDPEQQLKAQVGSDTTTIEKGKLLQGDAITVRHGNFGWRSGEDDAPLLKDVNITIPTSRLTIVIGPVGCGKSTLLKAILGETPVSEGSILLSTRDMSFCDQTPWLTNQTLQANITAFSKYDATWYSSVIRACALDQDLAQLPEGDQSMVGSKGITLSGGQKQRVAIARAVYARRPIAVFDDVFSGLDSETQKHVFDYVFGPSGLLRSQDTTMLLATHAVHLLPHADNIIALDAEGKVAAQGTFSQLNAKDGYIHRFGLEGLKEEASTAKDEEGADSKVDRLQNAEEEAVPKAMDDEARRLGDRTVYKYYFQQVGAVNMTIFFSILLIWIFMLKFPEIWLKWWGDANMRNPGRENGKYLGVYTVFQVLALTALALDARHLLLVIVVVSGKKLHASLLRTVLGAPMLFFASTDVGSIINRFSQDIQLIDAELPIAFLNVCANAFVVVAQAIMIIPASYWLVLTYPFLFGILYGVQKYYLRTSRQLRFLDLEAKSPLYSQFLETLSGLTTIRAFSWQDKLVMLNDQRLDRSQKPFYLLFSVQRWLNLVLDLITCGLAIVLTAVSINLRGHVSAGFAGVALYNIMTLSAAMKAAVTVWTVLETSIGAVARVKSFEETTPSENKPEESEHAPESWPSLGALELRGVSASYSDESPTVLNNISLSIKPGEKVGICGRSGSGKSSLILAIFRMIELKQGTITIDGIDITALNRGTLRERLNAIPQDPFFLSGTVRENCDPRGTSTDDLIENALRDVQLWDIIEARGGLGADLTQDFFSHGQRQLFCLARAILHQSKVVIMDEATSNVDIDTDKIMQEVIRTSFKDATVIAVAHRLDTILDFDTVLVVDKGVIIERDSPRKLLSQPSAFKTLYDTYDSSKEEASPIEAS